MTFDFYWVTDLDEVGIRRQQPWNQVPIVAIQWVQQLWKVRIQRSLKQSFQQRHFEFCCPSFIRSHKRTHCKRHVQCTFNSIPPWWNNLHWLTSPQSVNWGMNDVCGRDGWGRTTEIGIKSSGSEPWAAFSIKDICSNPSQRKKKR